MKRRIRLTESDLHRIVKESVKRVLREEYDGYYNSNGGTNAGYSGRDNYGNLTGWVDSDESRMRSVYQKLCNYGKMPYDSFDDWKRNGYPHANEV